MRKIGSAAILAMALVSGCATQQPTAGEPRIDSSSAKAAEASYSAMMSSRNEVEQQELALAVLLIGLEETKNVYDAIDSPNPSIATVRNTVAGMTAEEIIKRAAEVKNATAHPVGR